MLILKLILVSYQRAYCDKEIKKKFLNHVFGDIY